MVQLNANAETVKQLIDEVMPTLAQFTTAKPKKGEIFIDNSPFDPNIANKIAILRKILDEDKSMESFKTTPVHGNNIAGNLFRLIGSRANFSSHLKQVVDNYHDIVLDNQEIDYSKLPKGITSDYSPKTPIVTTPTATIQPELPITPSQAEAMDSPILQDRISEQQEIINHAPLDIVNFALDETYMQPYLDETINELEAKNIDPDNILQILEQSFIAATIDGNLQLADCIIKKLHDQELLSDDNLQDMIEEAKSLTNETTHDQITEYLDILKNTAAYGADIAATECHKRYSDNIHLNFIDSAEKLFANKKILNPQNLHNLIDHFYAQNPNIENMKKAQDAIIVLVAKSKQIDLIQVVNNDLIDPRKYLKRLLVLKAQYGQSEQLEPIVNEINKIKPLTISEISQLKTDCLRAATEKMNERKSKGKETIQFDRTINKLNSFEKISTPRTVTPLVTASPQVTTPEPSVSKASSSKKTTEPSSEKDSAKAPIHNSVIKTTTASIAKAPKKAIPSGLIRAARGLKPSLPTATGKSSVKKPQAKPQDKPRWR